VIGIVYFGLLRTGGVSSADSAVPQLRAQLTAAGLPAAQSDQVVAGFQTCFQDRVSEKDPSATPASCARIQQQIAASPAPPALKQEIQDAVLNRAVPAARAKDFTHAYQDGLFWQIGVLSASGLLVLALPKVKPTSSVPVAG